MKTVLKTSEKVFAFFLMKQIPRVYFVTEDSPASASPRILSTWSKFKSSALLYIVFVDKQADTLEICVKEFPNDVYYTQHCCYGGIYGLLSQ